MAGFTERFSLATRVNSFRREAPDIGSAIRAVAAVSGLTALELNYPQHLSLMADGELASLLDETGLNLTGLNLRFEGKQFANGAFTSPRFEIREEAIAVAREAVDITAAHGGNHVVLWMADDGFDYPFQVDYDRLWEDEIDGFRRVASHNRNVRVSVEYKPMDPRRFSLIRSMGDALLAAREVGLPNFGVTLDFCHSLMAGEHPPAVAAQALREQRLFGVHLNDGYGRADDGLIVGSIHPWHTIELLWLLRRRDYAGILYFDTFPIREDPAGESSANVAMVRRLDRLIDRCNWEELQTFQQRHDAAAAIQYLNELLWEPGDE